MAWSSFGSTSGAWERAEVLAEIKEGLAPVHVGVVNLAAARTVFQLRELMRATLGAKALPQPGFAFIDDEHGCQLTPAQEESWPATALCDVIVLRPSQAPHHATEPQTRRLEVWLAGGQVALGEVEVRVQQSAKDIKRTIRGARFNDLVPHDFLLVDRHGRIIAPADEPTVRADAIGNVVVLHPQDLTAVATPSHPMLTPAVLSLQAKTQPLSGLDASVGSVPVKDKAEPEEQTLVQELSRRRSSVGGREDVQELSRRRSSVGGREDVQELSRRRSSVGSREDVQLLDAGTEDILIRKREDNEREEDELRRRLQLEVQGEHERQQQAASSEWEQLLDLERQVAALEYMAAGGAAPTNEDPAAEMAEGAWHAPNADAKLREKYKALCQYADGQVSDAFHSLDELAAHHKEEGMWTWPAGKAPQVRAVRPEVHMVGHHHFCALWESTWPAEDDKAVSQKKRANAEGVPIEQGAAHMGLQRRSSASGERVQLSSEERLKRALVRRAWQLQAVLDFEYYTHAGKSLASRVGPWKLTKVLDAQGDSGVVLKAVRSCGDGVQERAVMLLPKPSADGEARALTEAEVRALERATMLSAVSSPSLPAVESEHGITPDYQLGWRFMEFLGDKVATMADAAAEGVAADEDTVQKRCHRAVKYGLKLLAALRPLHERGLVHTALAPKHIVRVHRGESKQAEYKLIGLGALHLDGEPFLPSHEPPSAHTRELSGSRGGLAAAQSTTLEALAYSSPEVREGKPVDARSDLYSVAAVLFDLVAGQPPYPPGRALHAFGEAEKQWPEAYDLSMLPEEGVDTALADILLRAMHPMPAERGFANIDAMESALHECAAATGEVFYHVYLSYPSAGKTEAALARKVYDELRKRELAQMGGGKVRVYLDRACNDVAGHGNWSPLQQFIDGIMHSVVFVPIVSRAGLVNLAGDVKPEDRRNKKGSHPPDPKLLKSDEKRFDERLGNSESGDLLLVEWQLALALHERKGGQHKSACQHVLPLFLGPERHHVAYTDEAGATPHQQLVGFDSVWGMLETDASGQQIGLRGSPDHKDDQSGFFWDKPLKQQTRILEEELFRKRGEDAPQVAMEAGRLSPAHVVRRLFQMQGMFADLLVQSPPEPPDVAGRADALKGKCGDPPPAPSKCDDGPADNGDSDKACAAACVWDGHAAVLSELAKKVATEIEKTVDDQCRDLRTLGLGAGAASVSGLAPLEEAFSYEQLLGKKLLRCGDPLRPVHTAEALAPPPGAKVVHVVLLFAEGTTTNSVEVAKRLCATLPDAGGELHVVYMSDDANPFEFDRFVRRSASVRGFFALPYRLMPTIGQRARKRFGVSDVPAVVVTKCLHVGGKGGAARGDVVVSNEDATMQILRGDKWPWPEETVQQLIEGGRPWLLDNDKNEHSVHEVLSGCEVLALYFGGSWCPHCNTFLPKAIDAYNFIKHSLHGVVSAEFEMLYVSSDRDDERAYDAYLKKMPWKAVPYADHGGREKRFKLRTRFKINAIPSVVLLHRDPRFGNGFRLVPGGLSGVTQLSVPLTSLHDALKSWKCKQLVLTLDGKSEARTQRCASLVVLCEHLEPLSAAYKQLVRAMEQVALAYEAAAVADTKAREADEAGSRTAAEDRRPQQMLFYTAPERNDATRKLRKLAGLPPATRGDETLEPLLLDLRPASCACFRYRGAAEVERWPETSLPSLIEEHGKRLSAFVELFVKKMQLPPNATANASSSPYHDNRVCKAL